MISTDSILISIIILAISCINKCYLVKQFKIIFMDEAECEALFNCITKQNPAEYSKDQKRRPREKSVSFYIMSEVYRDLLHIGATGRRTRGKFLCC